MTDITLSKAKSLLEKAVYAVTHFAFDNVELRAKYTVGGYFVGPLDDARYFYANSANRKTFEKHVAKMLAIDSTLADASKYDFIALVEAARSLYTQVEVMVAAEKVRLQAKREAIANKAAKKQELGTDLSKHERATEATYKTLRAALEPVRVSVEQHYVERLTERLAFLVGYVADNGGLRKAFLKNTYPGKGQALPEDFGFFFALSDWQSGLGYGSFKKHANITARIAAEALSRSVDEVTTFSGKLAGKIDRDADGRALSSAQVFGSTLWNNSNLEATLEDGAKQLWKTQIIWNQSCLGRVFNQWPTRRAD